jgi:hypothetical protein
VGTWGAGLYSGDFAADLRSTVSALSRLPFDGNVLVDLLCAAEPQAANNPRDEDHTTFWLVAADQFVKRGIQAERALESALRIIADGSDLAMHERLGMSGQGLTARQRTLEELRGRLSSGAPTAPRKNVLKKPQPLIAAPGDCLNYPTAGGDSINPYFPPEKWAERWHPDGWAAMMIVDAGRAFEFLAWYRAVTIATAWTDKPGTDALLTGTGWELRSPGTLSAAHFKRMALERVASLTISAENVVKAFSDLKPGTYQAIHDISISNEMQVAPATAASNKPRAIGRPARPRIERLSELLDSS